MIKHIYSLFCIQCTVCHNTLIVSERNARQFTWGQAPPQVVGTCRAPEGHRGVGKADREGTSRRESERSLNNVLIPL